MAFLAVAICAYRSTWRLKAVGVALGVPLLLGLNMMRLVHLFYLGVYRPQLFHVAHAYAWQAVMVAAVFILWLAWTLLADDAWRRNILEARHRPYRSLSRTRPLCGASSRSSHHARLV